MPRATMTPYPTLLILLIMTCTACGEERLPIYERSLTDAGGKTAWSNPIILQRASDE